MRSNQKATLTLCAVLCLTASAKAQTFTNVTTASGLNVPTGIWAYRGAAWADFNNDGAIDLFAPGGDLNPIEIYFNLGGGSFFAQQVAPAGTSFRRDNYCLAGDIDNDGDQDVFLCQGNPSATGAVPNRLYVNQGAGTFVEDAAARGLALVANSFCASFGDYNRDGWLDLVVGVYGYNPNNSGSYVLYRNNGPNAQGVVTFTNVSTAAGINLAANAYAVLFADFDRDLWPDIWCANDFGQSGSGAPIALYRNNRNGTFTNVAGAVNAAAPIDGMGITVADMHNDGDWDVLITNLSPAPCLLVYNSATNVFDLAGNYLAAATNYGLATAQVGWGCRFFDYNNDRLNDLFEMNSVGFNRLFRGQTGNLPFVDDTTLRGINTVLPSGFGCAVVDYDDDGDLDLYTTGGATSGVLAANPGVGGPNWIKVGLQGTVSNRSAIGATVICRSTSSVQRRQILSGEGFLGDGDKRAHFGLGADTVVTELEIRWPSGTVQYISNPPINAVFTVTEPTIAFNGPMTPGSSNGVDLGFPFDVGSTYLGAIVLDVAGEYYLSDFRAVRVNVNDQAIVQSTTFGNPYLGFYTGLVPGSGTATMQLNLPAIPAISGLGAYMIGLTINTAYPSSVKSILGPVRWVIQ